MMQETDAGTGDLNTIRYSAAALSLAAGLLHLFATFDYWAVWAGYAMFFMMLALVQVTYGLAMFFQPWEYERGGDRQAESRAAERVFLLVGALVTGAIILLWLVAHLMATPFGPMAGQRQPITFLSVAAVLAMAAQTWYLLRLIRLNGRANIQAESTLAGHISARDD